MSLASTAEVSVEIVRYVSDDFPGFVECVLTDADGMRHSIVDKAPVFSVENLLAASSYPCAGVVACEVTAEWVDETGRRLARVDTTRPWGIEATDGTTCFVVLSSQLRR